MSHEFASVDIRQLGQVQALNCQRNPARILAKAAIKSIPAKAKSKVPPPSICSRLRATTSRYPKTRRRIVPRHLLN